MAEREPVVWEDAPRRQRHARGGARVAGWVMLLGVLGVLSAAGLLLTAPEERGEVLEGVPRELAGRWATTDERYADRRLVIERERVELQLGVEGGERLRYPILEVRGWGADAERGYHIRYRTPEGQQSMEVFVAENGTLRLRNPPGVAWSRAP